MPKIITVTLNTALDQVVTLDTLTLGENLIAQDSAIVAAGKGINVGKALESLQQHSTNLGFVGELSRGYYATLQSPLLHTDFLYPKGSTRVNVTLATASPQQETHIRTHGYTVTAAERKQLIEKLKFYLQPDDIVVLSGSLPPGIEVDFYHHLIGISRAQGARVYLDSSGAALAAAINAAPDLVKPNQQELEALVGQPLSDESALLQAAQSLIMQGIKQVVVSQGEQGALLISAPTNLCAVVNYPYAPHVSTIGCGDALVAGLAFAALHRLSLSAALKLAVACGTANLYNAEPGRFDNRLLNGISKHVTVRRL